MAGLLNWTDEQREKAGLARPGGHGGASSALLAGGGSGNTLRLPSSPFHRTPSSPALSSEFFAEPTPMSSGKESLADLWATFLEQSVNDEATAAPSRKDSLASVSTAGGGRPDTRG